MKNQSEHPLLQNVIEKNLTDSSNLKKEMIEKCCEDIAAAARLIADCFKSGNKLLLCGNGGSAADAQHIAAEFLIRLRKEKNRPALPAIALTTNTSYLTAGSNDMGYEHIFSRSIEALGTEGDILIAISTSGNSPNILNAVNTAKLRNIHTIGLLGGEGGKVKHHCTLTIIIPSDNTQRIQEGHITTGHILCELVENILFE